VRASTPNYRLAERAVWSLARNNAQETEGGVFVKIWLAAKLPFE
jgi:hypothetical protein